MEKVNIDQNNERSGANIEKAPIKLFEQKSAEDMDVQARYDQLVKSGATAISSDMLFGREAEAAERE